MNLIDIEINLRHNKLNEVNRKTTEIVGIYKYK